MKAIWKGKIIAKSDGTIVVESNHYFPPESVNMEYLQKSNNTYTCAWKGVADYYNVVVDGEVNEDAAWVYPNPSEEAKHIAGRFAFWKGIEIKE